MKKKRNKLFEILINKNIDITLIQETHSTNKLTNQWEKIILEFRKTNKILRSIYTTKKSLKYKHFYYTQR